jgi:hypothetical protein
MTKASGNGKGEAVFTGETAVKVESQPAGPLPKTEFQTRIPSKNRAEVELIVRKSERMQRFLSGCGKTGKAVKQAMRPSWMLGSIKS